MLCPVIFGSQSLLVTVVRKGCKMEGIIQHHELRELQSRLRRVLCTCVCASVLVILLRIFFVSSRSFYSLKQSNPSLCRYMAHPSLSSLASPLPQSYCTSISLSFWSLMYRAIYMKFNRYNETLRSLPTGQCDRLSSRGKTRPARAEVHFRGGKSVEAEYCCASHPHVPLPMRTGYHKAR